MSKNSKRKWKELSKELVEDPPLPPKREMSTQEHLISIISTCLGGPRGDPDMHHQLAAAHAYIALRDNPSHENKTIEYLKRLEAENSLRINPWNIDFVDLAERNVVL